jgi:hypothetical protein
MKAPKVEASVDGHEVEAEMVRENEEHARHGKKPGPKKGWKKKREQETAQVGSGPRPPGRPPKVTRKVRIPRAALDKLSDAPLQIDRMVSARFFGRMPVYDEALLEEPRDAFRQWMGVAEVEVPPWAAWLAGLAVAAAFATRIPLDQFVAAVQNGRIKAPPGFPNMQPPPPPNAPPPPQGGTGAPGGGAPSA